MDRSATARHHLLDTADPAELRRLERQPVTDQQLLSHMLFGYLLIRRLRPLVLLLNRHPVSGRRGFAAILNAAARPFT